MIGGEVAVGFVLSHHECPDDYMFADEGGSWQVGVDWDRVLPA
jgi:hypothetical protein